MSNLPVWFTLPLMSCAMIEKYIADLARQMQIPLSSVTIVDDSSAKNLDSRLLKLSSGEHTSNLGKCFWQG